MYSNFHLDRSKGIQANFDFLLPGNLGLKLVRLVVLHQQIVLIAHSTLPLAKCPVCHTTSNKVHCYYTRSIRDLAWADLSVKFLIRVRRFACCNEQCVRRTFAERLGDEIKAYARRTTRCDERLRAIALALGGETGVRLARELGLHISPDTLVRLTRATPLPQHTTPRVLGVDDFAIRKGAKYGTIILDLERGAVIELLADRNMTTFAKWLEVHPGVEIISRDRGTAYAEAARLAAPNATQVADRFHLHQNLHKTLERIMRRYYPQIEKILALANPASELGQSQRAMMAPKNRTRKKGK